MHSTSVCTLSKITITTTTSCSFQPFFSVACSLAWSGIPNEQWLMIGMWYHKILRTRNQVYRTCDPKTWRSWRCLWRGSYSSLLVSALPMPLLCRPRGHNVLLYTDSTAAAPSASKLNDARKIPSKAIFLPRLVSQNRRRAKHMMDAQMIVGRIAMIWLAPNYLPEVVCTIRFAKWFISNDRR